MPPDAIVGARLDDDLVPGAAKVVAVSPVFCSNLAWLPATTRSKRWAIQVSSEKPFTRRPSFLTLPGSDSAMICLRTSSSLNRRALPAIIHCSVWWKVSPSTSNRAGNHWLRHAASGTPGFFWRWPQNRRYSKDSLAIDRSPQRGQVVHDPFRVARTKTRGRGRWGSVGTPIARPACGTE